ncbi:glycerophosphodiester phosphodiesterase [Microlunatus soli]|uniref:Glycerophosphoryl diester phosphodiesterase n=1 Tax=Microlunatus soli TaxID=630515 RepID=A0A1H1ZQ15_9ACTN|nr:glycerophosphodiester phosphodiesterase [Microlunatus soli]SDT35346.1 glycerophosphoryl diester phosphodiesterase [Microlunatus soli]
MTGHRGAMAHAPENTALSLVTAEQLGVDEIEFDVRLSADGVPVISHDDDLARVLGASPAPRVSTTAWCDLQRLRLPRGQRLLTLPEVLELTQSDLQIEVKAPTAPALVAEVLAEYPDDQQRCLLTSFQVPILAELQQLLPQIPRGVIANSYDDALRVSAHDVGASAVMSGWKGLTPAVVDRLHDEDIQVAGWPVRNADDAALAVELGVDMITADAPGEAREWLDNALAAPA